MNCSTLTQRCIRNNGFMDKGTTLLLNLTLIAVVLCAADSVSKAQDPLPTPTPVATATPTAEELRLQEENRLLELKKTNAGLKKEIRESQPKASATPLEGVTTADENVLIETQMVTYKAMSDIADRIGAEIHQKFSDARSIVIYDADELENLEHYRATSPILKGRIQSLKDQYRKVLQSLAAIPPLEASDSSEQAKATWKGGLKTITSDSSAAKNSTSMTEDISSLTSNLVNPIASFTEGLKVFADLLALVRTDTEIKGKAVSVEESAMVAETFRALRNRFGSEVNLYYPKVVSPEIYLEGCEENHAPVFCSATLSSLATLYAEKEDADNALLRDNFDVTVQYEKATAERAQAEGTATSLAKQIADLKLERLKAELTKPWNPAQATRFEKYIKELDTMKAEAVSAKQLAVSRLEHFAKRKNVLEQLQVLNEQANQLVASLVKADEKTGRSELANFMKAENMDKALGTEGYWLAFRSISAGGNNRTRTNLFRYFSGAKLDHSGGLVVEWALYNQNGKSVDSNKDSSYGGYVTPKELQSGRLKDAVADQALPAAPASPALASSKNH